MALRMFDGFEAFPLMRNAGNMANCSANVGRDGVGRGVYSNNNSASVSMFFPGGAFSSGIVGFGMKTMGTTCRFRIHGNGNSVEHLGVDIDGAGKPRVLRGGTVIATAVNPVIVDSWHYFELKFSIADAGGVAILKCDGVEVINFVGDTRNSGLGTIDAVAWTGRTGGPMIDDVYLLDTVDGTTLGQSAPFNDWLGERVIKAKRPVGSGASSDFVGSDGDSVDNWALVDDDPVSTTDFVASNVSGAKDLYAMGAATGLATVEAVQAFAYSSKSDSGARSMKFLVRDDVTATIDDAGTVPLSTSWDTQQSDILTKTPDGAAWTPVSVNAIQAGYEVV